MSYWRVILRGGLGTVESWSTSVAFGIVGLAPDIPDQNETDGIAQAIAAALSPTAVPAALRALLSTNGSLDQIRVEYRAENETVLNVAERLLASVISGTGAANKTPQDAIVFSLRTSTPGARGRGRMYWPALNAGLSATFQLNVPAPADVVAGAKVLLQLVNTAIDSYYISIASVRRAALSVRSGTDHVCRDVNTIQVGSVLDTQRRRRDALPESYLNVAYP